MEEIAEKPTFVCSSCHQPFVREMAYLQHKCKRMKRAEEVLTITGQRALHYYMLWFKEQKRISPPAEAFVNSHYYETFIQFAKFAIQVELPRVDKFIWYMVLKKIAPSMWKHDLTYVLYIEFLDTQLTPIEQAKISIDTLNVYANKMDIDVSESIDNMTVQEVIHKIRIRKLSPWLLLFSPSFHRLFGVRANPEQKLVLEQLIRVSYWSEKKLEYPDEVASIKQLVAAMGI